jgi:hypothetical protein
VLEAHTFAKMFNSFEGVSEKGLMSVRFPTLQREQIEALIVETITPVTPSNNPFELQNFVVAEIEGRLAGSLLPYHDREGSMQAEEAWDAFEERLYHATQTRYGEEVASFRWGVWAVFCCLVSYHL